ncbi:MAG: hypothetical protein IJ424_00420 [Oscillospiraceae bacterium]|nr:hypothetical protein [Oscillospiraceae bacterium]
MAKGKTKSVKNREKEPFLILLAKSAMTILFLWSGFFWSGVSIINFYGYSPEYSYRATGFLAGSLLMLTALILCYARLYIIQLPFTVAGLIPFLKMAGELIDEVVEHPELTYRPPSYELRYMPMIAFAVLSVALAMEAVWKMISKRMEAKNEFNNRPSKSILD